MDARTFFELDNFTSPAWIARLDYVGVPGLRIGGSFYFINDAGGNADKLNTYTSLGKIPVSIWNVDGEYVNKYFIMRGNIISGHVGKSSGASPALTTAILSFPLIAVRHPLPQVH